MGKLIVSAWTTLDGYVAGPEDEMDWLRLDDEMQAYEMGLLEGAGALLLGRVTHGDFAGHWPAAARDPDTDEGSRRYARAVDALPKVVVSASGRTAEWAGTTRWSSVESDLVDGLKQSSDGDVIVYGSLSIVQALTDLTLVDEYHLLVHPVVLRQGKPLFGPGSVPVRLDLVAARIFSSGVVLSTYRRTG